MSILPCPHSVLTPPRELSRKQIVLPAVHDADDDAPPERLSARPRRLATPSPAPFPLAGRLRRTCGASGPDRGKPADGQPRRPSARGTHGHRVTHQIYGHLVPSSFDRARTTLDNAYHESRHPGRNT
jgi:hypothetical protein